MKPWLKWFEDAEVRVVFNGHEHNFQFTKQAETGGVLYVVTGSGGELRSGSVQSAMASQHIAGWAPVPEFLYVEIDGSEMRILPVSTGSPTVVNERGEKLEMPIRVRQ